MYNDLSKWDGLKEDWQSLNFVNPPYSLNLKTDFVKKADMETYSFNTSILLLPVSTSTILFKLYVEPKASEIRFIQGRLRFIGINDKGQKVNHDQIMQTTKETILYEGKEIPLYVNNSGMHDSMLVIFE